MICYTLGLRFKFALEYKCVIYLIMVVILLTGYNHMASDMCNKREFWASFLVSASITRGPNPAKGSAELVV
jgi:hypothetical protein